jgi:hypothetical protein
MKPRRLVVFVAALVAIAAGVVGLILSHAPRSEAATRAAFGRITLGMTEAEVRALLGGSPQSRAVTKGAVLGPDNFSNSPVIHARQRFRNYTFCECVVPHWQGTSYMAVVFDGDAVACRYLTVASPSAWDRVRAALE